MSYGIREERLDNGMIISTYGHDWSIAEPTINWLYVVVVAIIFLIACGYGLKKIFGKSKEVIE